MSRGRSRALGFTLIELMIAVAVVAILARLALAYYSSAQIKNRRAVAEAFLSTVAQQEQQYFIDNRDYARDSAGPPAVSALGTPGLSTVKPSIVSDYYTITITADTAANNPPPNFLATATPIAGTPQANDVTLSISNTGAKTPTKIW